MAVQLSVGKSPRDAKMQDESGLPWGAAVTPFAVYDEKGLAPLFLSSSFDAPPHPLPRCDTCFAYLSSLCEIDQFSWRCAICDSLNSFSEADARRYSSLQNCPELSSSFIDMLLPDDNTWVKDDFQGQPVFVAAVDLSASEEFLELVKSALLAALEALESGVLFGLATFSHKIGLYDVQGPIPIVKNVIIPPDLDGHVPVELEDVMPLRSFLAPVEKNKENIAAALETLKPTSSWERTTAAGQGIEGVTMGGRGFGVAMDAVLNYLGAEHGITFAIGRVFAFLSGAPDYGAGQLDTKRYGEQYASKGEDADKALLPEQTPFYKDLEWQFKQGFVWIFSLLLTNIRTLLRLSF